ncbi:MAG: SDR family oxidoreductase [Porticoccaceae bacterium]
MSGITGKVIAITGASSGIGEATARVLARQGSKVVLGARRGERLAAVADAIRSEGGEVAVTSLDVTSQESVATFVSYAISSYGRLDVLVNNAGIMPLSRLSDLRVKDWEQMIDVNIKGVLYGIAAALPVFDQQQSGQFINVTSGADRVVAPSAAVYSGTKFAVRAISDGLRMEVGQHIRVAVIAPGATSTELTGTISDPALKAAVEARTFANAMPPEAVAAAIAYAIGQPANVDVREILVGPATAAM